MKAMILAAGRGERMRPLTDAAPKPLLRVNDKPLIQYHLESLAAAGIVEVVINLAWLGAQISNYLGDGSSYGLKITYTEEPAGALETGGGIFQALPLLGDEPFLIVNGDVFCEFDYRLRMLDADSLGHLVMVPNPAHHPAGDFSLADGQVTASGEHTLTYSGISILHPELFAACEPGRFPLAPLLNNAIDRGRLTGELFSGLWTDVGTPERLTKLDTLLRYA